MTFEVSLRQCVGHACSRNHDAETSPKAAHPSPIGSATDDLLIGCTTGRPHSHACGGSEPPTTCHLAPCHGSTGTPARNRPRPASRAKAAAPKVMLLVVTGNLASCNEAGGPFLARFRRGVGFASVSRSISPNREACVRASRHLPPIHIESDRQVSESRGTLGVSGTLTDRATALHLSRAGKVTWSRHYAETFVPADRI